MLRLCRVCFRKVIPSLTDQYSFFRWIVRSCCPKLAELEHMQPTAAANLPPPGGDMDLQAMQSMDWLFKKERIYLLAQFWQQVGLFQYFFFAAKISRVCRYDFVKKKTSRGRTSFGKLFESWRIFLKRNNVQNGRPRAPY